MPWSIRGTGLIREPTPRPSRDDLEDGFPKLWDFLTISVLTRRYGDSSMVNSGCQLWRLAEVLTLTLEDFCDEYNGPSTRKGTQGFPL